MRPTALFLLACLLGSCSAIGPFSGPRRFGSFLDVRFGDSLLQVQMLHPRGNIETSPYGADDYTLKSVDAEGVHYEFASFEFSSGHGMQLVFARFSPESAGTVFERLRDNLGAPSTGGEPADSSPQTTDAAWRTSDETVVRFVGPRRYLIIVGPYGKSLEPDIKLRSEAESP
ncbi:MAG: hypothetical protein WA005_17560 [Candidatus Binataceae bacterium]